MAGAAFWLYEVQLWSYHASQVIDGGDLEAPADLDNDLEVLQAGNVFSGSLEVPVVLDNDLGVQ